MQWSTTPAPFPIRSFHARGSSAADTLAGGKARCDAERPGFRHSTMGAARDVTRCGRVAGNLVLCLAMPISQKFVVNFTTIALAVGFLSLLAIIGATIWLGERAQVYFDDAVRLRDTRTAAVELRSALQSAESSQRGYLIGGNEIYLAPFDTAKAEARSRLRRLEELLATTEPTAAAGAQLVRGDRARSSTIWTARSR